jgi:hypothetical protein
VEVSREVWWCTLHTNAIAVVHALCVMVFSVAAGTCPCHRLPTALQSPNHPPAPPTRQSIETPHQPCQHSAVHRRSTLAAVNQSHALYKVPLTDQIALGTQNMSHPGSKITLHH